MKTTMPFVIQNIASMAEDLKFHRHFYHVCVTRSFFTINILHE